MQAPGLILMIRQWNDHVTKKDEVYILGDFSISRGKAANEVLEQLNGKKYLIEGNHDKFLDDKEFDRSLFRWIRPYAEIRDCRRQVILSHYPVFCCKGQYRMTPEGTPLTYMLYGHVHNTHEERLVNEFIRITRSIMVKSARQTEEHPIPCNMINCFCMFSDYIPLTLDDWIRLDKGKRERTDTIQGHIIQANVRKSSRNADFVSNYFLNSSAISVNIYINICKT
jgi:calcineurin-like phosphoesterase family protein